MKRALTYIWMDLFLNLGPPERQCVLTHAILKQLAQEAEVQIHNASTRCKAYTVKKKKILIHVLHIYHLFGVIF